MTAIKIHYPCYIQTITHSIKCYANNEFRDNCLLMDFSYMYVNKSSRTDLKPGKSQFVHFWNSIDIGLVVQKYYIWTNGRLFVLVLYVLAVILDKLVTVLLSMLYNWHPLTLIKLMNIFFDSYTTKISISLYIGFYNNHQLICTGWLVSVC